MYAVGRLGSYISRGVYSVSAPFHPFGGAVDIIVVEQPDGSFKSSPWYVRFGKFQGVLKASTKVVSICVNGNEANFHMFLDNKGEAYFLREVDFKEGESEAVSFPFPSGYETDEPSSGNRRPMKSISCNSDADKSNSEGQVVVRNENVVARTSSHGSRIFGLVFGQRSTKEDGYQEESVGAAVKNAGSLEPADIAAELLDIKWSTNLASNRSNDNASQFSSAKDALDNKGSEGEMQINEEENRFQSSVHDKEEETNDEENQFQSSVHDKAENVNDEKNQFHSSVHDKEGNSIDRQTLLDEKVSCSHSGLENLEYSVEESSIQVSCISTEQQIVENSSSSDGMEDKYRVIANVSGSIDDHNVGNFDDNENEMDDDNAENINDEENQFHSSVHDKEGNSIDRQTLLDEKVSCSHSGLENLDYSVEESSVQVSCVSTKQQIVENSSLSLGMEDKYRVIANISGSIDDHSVGNFDDNENEIGAVSGMSVPDLQSQYKPEECADKQVDEEPADNERNVVLPGCDISSKETVLERVQSFVYCETSESSVITLDGTSEQTQQTLCVSDVGNGKVHVHAETLVTMTEPVPEVTILKQAEYVELDSEGAITASDSYSQTVSVDPVICSVEEVKSDIIHSTSTVNDLGDQVEDGKNTVDVLQPSLESVDDSQNFYGDSDPRRSVAPSESSEVVQFLFSDLDELKLHESDSLNKDLRPSICTEIEEVNGLCYVNNESYLNPDEFIWENPSTDLEKSVEKLSIVSNPISISRNHRVAVEKNGWRVKSLPNIWSPVTKFDASNYHPLSQSLDSNSETMKWTLIRKDGSNCMRSDADEEQPLAQEKSSGEESETFEKLKSTLYNPAVEISLCKHLLYEGMGTEAACQVFDAEKLDSKKVNSLDPVLVKNDRLVVRIAGHYFPWDAAAPILSGMDTFGTREIFESKGMILVDRVEKSIEGDPSKAIVSRRGSWRIWPFSLKRSRSRKAVQPAPADTRDLDAENAADGTVASDNDKILQKPKQVKKMIREITPTSEQLASLSLKDGMNHITFTFSTAMLGKQQVDARIYLWKWNTRIVVSDVDGTITKSDVLGQFMPLVGMDWSQTGVAHLFSSIKENGYQLLFLSARAISQAYLTRKFLANLKQDGKALPDGPIVISPDGLFPSLYREVIRRVPQEFKIACLEEIMALFPSDCKPFYAGFGNRDTDEISYVKVGIPKGKIFIINPKGEVAVNRLVDTKSYSSLHALVHDMFPPMASEQEDFNSWNFWKLPPPLIDM